jgi:hypothetical protein
MSGSICSIFSVSFQLIKHQRISHQFSHLAISEHLRSWCLHVFITGEECYMSGHAACAVAQPTRRRVGQLGPVEFGFFGHPIALNEFK